MREKFGNLPNGEPVERFSIGNGDLHLTALTYGAAIQSINLKGIHFSLCLGFETLDEYLGNSGCVGAIVGRVANRISGGQAEIDGKFHAFDRNENGRHTLHSGASNLANRNWSLAAQSENALRFKTQLPAGESGFPGNLKITADYILHDANRLEIILEARTDAPTLCNLAPHPYFNLNGGGDSRKQALSIDAAMVTETNDEKIPTGNLTALSGTPWDHQSEKRMDRGVAYDYNYCVGNERTALRPVAHLIGLEAGVTMQIATTEPGLQVYDGSGLTQPYAGIALEPQCWPDAPNHPGFPSIVLRPGETSQQVTQLTFSRS